MSGFFKDKDGYSDAQSQNFYNKRLGIMDSKIHDCSMEGCNKGQHKVNNLKMGAGYNNTLKGFTKANIKINAMGYSTNKKNFLRGKI